MSAQRPPETIIDTDPSKVREGARMFPATFAQQRLWFLDQLEPGNVSYIIPWSMRITGSLDAGALERALNGIVNRHDVLRSTFAAVDGEVMQVFSPSLRIPLPVEVLSLSSNRQGEAGRLASEEALKPMDLANGPLVRARLLRLNPEDHLLLLTVHHIIFDRWSRGILARELAALYEAFRDGRASPLPQLRMHYGHYAVWQRREMQGKRYQKQLAYWRDQLAEAPAALELPTDRPRPAVQRANGASKNFRLSQELAEKLGALSKKHSATLFMTMLAAFQALLARYSGQEEIVVGTPIANRNRAEFEGMIGFFTNTLLLRLNLSGDPTFEEMMSRARNVALEAYESQDVPFEKLVQELKPERSLSHNPMFQVLFSLQSGTGQSFRLPGLDVVLSDRAGVTGNFDLSVFLSQQPGELSGVIEYNAELFDGSTIERMLGHYRTLLEAVAANPELRLSQLPLLTAPEREQLLAQGNDTRKDYPRHACLHQLIEQQADRSPDTVACVCGEEQLTYRELNERANKLARYLRLCGAGPDHLVGIFVQRSVSMLVGLLGILKAGAAYLPLDPSFPAERIRFMLEDAQVPLLLTQESLINALPAHDAEVVCLDRDEQKIAAQDSADFAGEAGSHDRAYVLYTSGSTGRPKGVEITHRNVVNFLSSMQREPGLNAEDTLVAVTTLSFDIAGLELYLPLITGAKVVLASTEQAADARQLAGLLKQSRATVLQATPATWRMLLEVGWEGDRNLKVLCGGEALAGDLADQLIPRCRELWNLYGPTETTIWSAVYKVEDAGTGTVSIGKPIANTTLYVLDAHGQPVPVGVAGELCIGGDGVGRGYLNQPELSAEKFVADPFRPGARMYRTGDLAKYGPDGNVHFLGRMDQQVKVRGFRIELGEVEAVLSRHPAVQECVVVVREDTPGDRRLVGYVVGAQGQTIDPVELRNWVKQYLPDYMTPSAIVELERLPLSPNGKVDRKKLPAPDYRRQKGDGHPRPWTLAEEVIAGIWEEALKLSGVGVDDNFFDLGGHSLLGTQVISRIREAFHVELPLRALFESPTVAGLAERTEALERGPHAELAPALRRSDREGWASLSYAQQRLWFLDQWESHQALYHVPYVVRLQGKLDRVALERSLNEIIRRHEALRTRFEIRERDAVQVIDPKLRIELENRDLRGFAGDVETEARRLAAEEIQCPFDLRRGPLMRATLMQLSDHDHVLLLNTHHIVSDRWSIGVLAQELGALYQAYQEGRASPLEELPLQYADYALWQREYLSGERLDRQMAYWKKRLEGAPAVLELPTDRPRPTVESFRGAQISEVLPATLRDSLKQIGRKENATLFMALLAAFNVLLSRYSGQDDIVVGTPIAGRHHAPTEKLIGFFVNTLVLRTDVSGDPSFHQLLARVRETAVGAYAHQDLPFEKLVEELNPDRGLGRNPLFQVAFVLQNGLEVNLELPGLAVSRFQAHHQGSKFDLMLIAVEQSEGLRLILEYNTDLFDASTMARMLGHFRTLLEAISAGDARPVARLPLLTEPERRQVLYEWNQQQAQYPSDRFVHELFEEQVRRTPDSVAVVFEDASLSYAELNRRANRLAHYLKGLGVGPDTRVAICLERSFEMLVGLLGVLKAGGAYVPLDPAYPPERLSYMLANSAPVALLSHGHLNGLWDKMGLAIPILDLADTDAPWRDQVETDPDRGSTGLTAEHLAYVIYTSGSTGAPKGVMVEHQHLTRLFTATDPRYQFGENDVWTLFHSFSFDFSVWEIWGALLYGGRLIVVPKDVARSPEEFYSLVCRGKVTVLNQTPSAFRQLMAAQAKSAEVHRLRYVILGGEAVELATLKPWFEQSHSQVTQLINGYGTTETTVFATFQPLEWADTEKRGGSQIGRNIPDLPIYILDKYGEPMPIGLAGELYIGGAGVARGYMNRPELTAERFLKDPFRAQKSARIYKTGDLGKWLPDGTVDFIGRNDFQVKIRGFRIELGEIEATLAAHPAVQESVVIVREDAAGERRLVAYLVLRDEAATGQELRAHLKTRLPSYMIPSAFVPLKALPLTSNGKVDRKNLPEPETPHSKQDEPAPLTVVEEMLASLFAEVLRRESVGIDENFFELGGHSLSALQVVARVREVLKVQLPVRALFESPVVRPLAEVVEQIQRSDAGLTSPAITLAPRDRSLPLSFAQQRLWVLQQMDPKSALYNVPAAVRLKGSTNVEAVGTALRGLVQRHEILRTTYRVGKNDEPVQVIAADPPVDIRMVDLSGLPEAARESESRIVCIEEAQKPFDLANDTMIRALVIRLDSEDHILFLNTHHIAYDGWSSDIVQREFAAFYEAALEGKSPSLPPLPVQYADYSIWQRNWLQGEVLEKHLVYWKTQVSGAPPVLHLPTDKPRPALQTGNGATHKFLLSQSLSREIIRVGQQHGATSFMAMLAAFQSLLLWYTNQSDIVLGTDAANRTDRQTEGLIGFFVNLLMLRTDLSGDPTFQQLLSRVREVMLGAYAHQEMPFDKLVEELRPERSPSYHPLVQVLFVQQHGLQKAFSIPGVEASPFPLNVPSKFDMAVFTKDTGNGVACTWVYNPDLFEPATIERMAMLYRIVLEKIAGEPAVKLSTLTQLLAESERQLRAASHKEFQEVSQNKLKMIKRRTGVAK